jgi:hypothetical protein
MPRAVDPAVPEYQEMNPYQISSRQWPRVPCNLAESRQFNTARQQQHAGAAAHSTLLLKTSKTMWTWDITSMSMCPLVCRTGWQRPQELYMSILRTNNRSTSQDQQAWAPPLVTIQLTLVQCTSLHFRVHLLPTAHGPCFELTEHSVAPVPLATSGDSGQQERHMHNSYNASAT